jgi:microcystin degradation protein MlrC
MRIAVAGMMHETNTFTSLRTSLSDFTVARGGTEMEGVAHWRGNVFHGVMDTLKAAGAVPVALIFARALPSGMVEAEAVEDLMEEIAEGIRKAGKLDGVCLALHGSMCAEGIDDPEGELLARIRDAVGPETPIVCALDMHATMTRRMGEYADGFAAYRTAPHIDEYDTGKRAARLVLGSAATGRKLAVEWAPIPFLIAGEQSETGVSPMKELMEALREAERTGSQTAGSDEGAPDQAVSQNPVLSASYLLGFPWADSPFGGAAALVCGYADERSKLAEAARGLAGLFWEKRGEFAFSSEAATLGDALDRAREEKRKPVVISDSGDNPTAGASQDLVVALKEMLERRLTNALFASVYDPEAVRASLAALPEAPFRLRVGRLDSSSSFPSRLEADAVLVGSGRVRGVNYSVVRMEGVTIVIGDKRTAVYDPSILRELGLRPETFDLIVVKSGYLSPEYKAIAGRALLALTPGDTNERLAELPYRRLPRPIFPLDPM